MESEQESTQYDRLIVEAVEESTRPASKQNTLIFQNACAVARIENKIADCKSRLGITNDKIFHRLLKWKPSNPPISLPVKDADAEEDSAAATNTIVTAVATSCVTSGGIQPEVAQPESTSTDSKPSPKSIEPATDFATGANADSPSSGGIQPDVETTELSAPVSDSSVPSGSSSSSDTSSGIQPEVPGATPPTDPASPEGYTPEVEKWIEEVKAMSHPAANKFPMMSMAELTQLANDIRKNGQIEAVVLHDQKIVDGRNRTVACRMADVKPRQKALDDFRGALTPTGYVISRNVHRRHLTTGQRALIAAELLPLYESEAEERRGKRTDVAKPVDPQAFGRSAEKLAALMSISPDSVKKGAKIAETATEELKSAVAEGKVALDAAAELATQPKEEQKKIVASGSSAVKQAAAKIRIAKRVASGKPNLKVVDKPAPLADRLKITDADKKAVAAEVPKDVPPYSVTFDPAGHVVIDMTHDITAQLIFSAISDPRHRDQFAERCKSGAVDVRVRRDAEAGIPPTQSVPPPVPTEAAATAPAAVGEPIPESAASTHSETPMKEDA